MSRIIAESAGSLDPVPEALEKARGDERISQLSGDRMCARCAFNLHGQTIVREGHYGLLMVRCPECATMAALQEYPLLGRWSTRLRYVTAAVWLGLMMILVALSATAIWGEANDTLARLASPYTEKLREMWSAHAAEEQKGVATAGVVYTSPWNYNPAKEKDWWDALDQWRVFAEAGGWKSGIRWSGLWELLPAAIILGCLGSVMAVGAPHAKLRGRLLIGGMVFALGGVFLLMGWLGARTTLFGYGGYYVVVEGQARLAPYVLPPCALACAGLYVLGLWGGRAVARGVVRVLLPPRLRGPLAFLWLADGKAIPR